MWQFAEKQHTAAAVIACCCRQQGCMVLIDCPGSHSPLQLLFCPRTPSACPLCLCAGLFDCKPLQFLWAKFPEHYGPHNTIM